MELDGTNPTVSCSGYIESNPSGTMADITSFSNDQWTLQQVNFGSPDLLDNSFAIHLFPPTDSSGTTTVSGTIFIDDIQIVTSP
jgi:hypothetical protein